MPLIAPLSLIAVALVQSPPPVPVAVRVDSAHHRVVITAGPYRLPPNAPGLHAEMDHEPEDLLVQEFAWPITTWIRGFRLEVVDPSGRQLPRSLMHHMSMMNFDRREVVYPIVERLLGAGRETGDIVLPRTAGVPVTAGHRLGLYIMWDNQTGTEIPAAYLRLIIPWISPRQVPRPATALPFLVDVNFVFGGSNSFTVPPGRSTRTYDFSVPLAGHLLAAGGHLHDHGIGLRLEDTRSGKTLVRIQPKCDRDGRIVGMPRKLFGTRGRGPRLRPDRVYRLVVEYDNPTGEPLPHVMGSIAGLFVPDDLRRLPALDPANPDYRADIEWLNRIKDGGATRRAAAEHQHVHHGDPPR
jgi:hypothetical protein